jgi:hypothetical protein
MLHSSKLKFIFILFAYLCNLYLPSLLNSFHFVRYVSILSSFITFALRRISIE